MSGAGLRPLRCIARRWYRRSWASRPSWTEYERMLSATPFASAFANQASGFFKYAPGPARANAVEHHVNAQQNSPIDLARLAFLAIAKKFEARRCMGANLWDAARRTRERCWAGRNAGQSGKQPALCRPRKPSPEYHNSTGRDHRFAQRVELRFAPARHKIKVYCLVPTPGLCSGRQWR